MLPLSAEIDTQQLFLCQTQGNLFELAWRKGYRMSEFVEKFMNSQIAARLDSPYSRTQWDGEERLLHDVAEECSLFPDAKPDDVNSEALFWAGYLYRYWHYYTGESSKEMFAKTGFRRMMYTYPGYHTLACEKAIQKLLETDGGVAA